MLTGTRFRSEEYNQRPAIYCDLRCGRTSSHTCRGSFCLSVLTIIGGYTLHRGIPWKIDLPNITQHEHRPFSPLRSPGISKSVDVSRSLLRANSPSIFNPPMEEGTTNQEAHMDEISAIPLCSEPEAGSQPNTEATINPNACVQTHPLFQFQPFVDRALYCQFGVCYTKCLEKLPSPPRIDHQRPRRVLQQIQTRSRRI